MKLFREDKKLLLIDRLARRAAMAFDSKDTAKWSRLMALRERVKASR